MQRQSTALGPAEKLDEVLALIEAARRRAYQAVNSELGGLSWELGAYVSNKIAWGEGDRRRLAVRPVVSSLSERPVSHAREASA